MTAKREIIPTEMTLEMGDNPSPADFLSAVRAFFGYVSEVGKLAVPEGESPQWVVRVREGSNLVGLEAAPNVAPEIARSTYALAAKGMRYVAEGKIEQSGLTPHALTHLRTLSELAAPNEVAALSLRVWINHAPVEVTPKLAQAIHEDERADYRDFGTVEGRLEAIQEKNNALQLQVRDALLKQNIRCYFSETMLSDAFKLFRKRVEVGGMIHYRKNGDPISIHVATIDELPDDSELPTAADVRGLLKVVGRR